MNSTEPPPIAAPLIGLQRRSNSPMLWVALATGSIVLHGLLLAALRLYWARLAVEAKPAPIAIDFIQPPPRTATANSVAARNQPSTPTGNQPTPAATAPNPATEQPDAAAQPALQPLQATIPARRERQPLPSQPRNEPQADSPPQPAANSPRPSPQPNQPDTTNPTPSTAPTGEETQAPTGSDNLGQSPTTEPVASGRELPALQGKVLVEVLSTRERGDFKAQPAEPKELRQQVPVYLPVKPQQPIELEVYLEIDQAGNVLKAEPIASDSAEINEETQQSLARQIATGLSFNPAQDGDPPQPVLSDLIVKLKITVL